MQKIGKYEWDTKKGFLGEGSFGKVFKGTNQETGAVVAVKCMDMSAFKDPYMLDSLKNEIKVMKNLTSPNVVKMFDVLHNPQTTFIILEFCKDGDLSNHIRKQGGLIEEKDACQVLNQLLHGFKNLVNLGYIHRDIKPANALVDNGVFKVADFGFATKVDVTGRQLLKEQVGTPLYMAPQLLEKQPYTAKSDIWSIGMMFYEMLFGKTPWPCRDLNSFIKNMKTQPLRFPYRKPIGKETKSFLLGCLQPSENKRFTWDDVFAHPISQMTTGEIEEPVINLDDKAQQIIRKMHEIIQTHNLNIEQIFSNFDKDHSGELNEQEFYQMMNVIDQRITNYEANYIFKLVDTSKDGLVNRQEFQSLFLNYDFSDLTDKAGQIITDLKEIVKANNLNLQQIFQKFDHDKGGTLDKQEFAKLIRVVAPGLREYEVQECFKKFDQNNDGTVDFNEFYKVLSYGIQNQDHMYDLQEEKAVKLVEQLKVIINKYKLELGKIFENFDKSKDGNLDFTEFTKLCHVIDKTLPAEDVKCIFRKFDKNGTGDISYIEFYKTLE